MIDLIQRFIIPAAYTLLPAVYNSDRATAMLLATGLQETKFRHRRQLPRLKNAPPGPARGFWQFERGAYSALAGILTHRRTSGVLALAIAKLRYAPFTVAHLRELQACLEHNDVLGAVCARCLLLTLDAGLPGPEDVDEAYKQYLEAWQPGSKRPEDWPGNYAEAWGRVRLGLEGVPNVVVTGPNLIDRGPADAGDRTSGDAGGAAADEPQKGRD